MPRKSVFDMSLSSVYRALLQKAQRKGRTKEELDTVGKTMELLDSGIIAELLRKKSTDEDENGSIVAEDIACAALIESSTCW